MIYTIIVFLGCAGLLLTSLLLALKSGYDDGWLDGYSKAKEEDFGVVFGIKENK